MMREFLHLGKQPIANGFIKPETKEEFFFNLRAGFDEETGLVSLMEFVDKSVLFNDDYKYYSSSNPVMVKHFRDIAKHLKETYNPPTVLEIGSNDGAFLKHWDKKTTFAVEPCKNFAEMTQKMGYSTYPGFWNKETSEAIKLKFGKIDLVFAANCMCHIPEIDEAFDAVSNVLFLGGLFVFEDPSLLSMMKLGSYDQIYDEHAHIFSVTALQKLLRKHDLYLIHIDQLTVHGNSNRIYAMKGLGVPDESVSQAIEEEKKYGLDTFEAYEEFARRVQRSRDELRELVMKYKSEGKKVVGYGATSKSTVVYNYCGLDHTLIDYVSDTTPAKVGLLMPGVRIPIIHRKDAFQGDEAAAFLGAWNYKEDIVKKEDELLKRLRFISHVPNVYEISYR